MSDKKPIDIKDIMQTIKHRYPFLLVDKIVDVEPMVKATAIKAVSVNEPYFQGHFPDFPVMPGVLIIEAMAQAAAVMVMSAMDEKFKGKNVFFTGIEEAKFRHMVVPGDLLRLEVVSLQHSERGNRLFWRISGKAYVEDKLVTEAELKAVITD